MNKRQLIENISEATFIPEIDVKEMLETMIIIINNVLSGDCEENPEQEVVIDNLGKFYTVNCKAKNILDFNGNKITLEERKAPRFKPSRNLREVVKRGYYFED